METMEMYEPIIAEIKEINYCDVAEYIKSWPDKLVSYVCDHLVDDDMHEFVEGLYDHICYADKDGPAFEEWRKS